MATFQYEALNAESGKTEKGELNVADQAEALARLQEMGLAPIKVDPVKKEGPKKAKAKRGAAKGKKGAKAMSALSAPFMSARVAASWTSRANSTS